MYAYEVAHTYGPLGCLAANNFSNASEYNAIMKKAEKQRNSRVAHEVHLKYLGKDWKDIPVWAFVDFLTIADISFLYKISESQIKRTVAEHMNLRVQGDTLLEKFMHSMTHAVHDDRSKPLRTRKSPLWLRIRTKTQA